MVDLANVTRRRVLDVLDLDLGMIYGHGFALRLGGLGGPEQRGGVEHVLFTAESAAGVAHQQTGVAPRRLLLVDRLVLAVLVRPACR